MPALLLFAAATLLAPPSDTRLQAAFSGTIVSTYPDGRTAKLWLEPAGGYTAVGRRRTPSSGRWSVKGDRICLKQQKPFPSPFSYCTPLPDAQTWTAKAVTGEPIAVRLVDGGR